ncbi:MAG: (2Fe-2S)-binding protein [Pseudomonadota bacterium]
MSLFRRATPIGETVNIVVDGNPVAAQEGDTVATVLLCEGRLGFGAKEGPLTPYCLIGVCFGCRVTIDGRDGEQACLIPVREGLQVETEATGERS